MKLPILESIGDDWLLERSGSASQSEDERSAKRDALMQTTDTPLLELSITSPHV